VLQLTSTAPFSPEMLYTTSAIALYRCL